MRRDGMVQLSRSGIGAIGRMTIRLALALEALQAVPRQVVGSVTALEALAALASAATRAQADRAQARSAGLSASPRRELNPDLALRRHLFYPLNYGERGEYSETPHVESAPDGHEREPVPFGTAAAYFLINPARASTDAARRGAGSMFSTVVGDNCTQAFCNAK
jgi:hypothetical protein